jgi:mRNA-degrading endonuclease toxin of MazEF toxin-antitoxin module
LNYIPKQGDIIEIDFDPSAGSEIMKRRPAFVLSRHAFNEKTELAIVAPITSTVRGIKLEVLLPKGLTTSGSVLVHQIKSLDFSARNAKLIEKAPDEITRKVCDIAKILVTCPTE